MIRNASTFSKSHIFTARSKLTKVIIKQWKYPWTKFLCESDQWMRVYLPSISALLLRKLLSAFLIFLSKTLLFFSVSSVKTLQVPTASLWSMKKIKKWRENVHVFSSNWLSWQFLHVTDITRSTCVFFFLCLVPHLQFMTLSVGFWCYFKYFVPVEHKRFFL